MSKMTINLTTYPEKNLSQQLTLLKSALLYGDEVKLYNPLMSLSFDILNLKNVSTLQLIIFMENFIPYFYKYPEIFGEEAFLLRKNFEQIDKHSLNKVKELLQNKSKNKNKQEILFLMQSEKLFQVKIKPSLNELASVINTFFPEGNLEDFLQAINKKELKIYNYNHTQKNSYIEDAIEEFTEVLIGNLNNKSEFSLFDSKMSNLVSSLVSNSVVSPSNFYSDRSKHIGFASEVLKTIPNFDNASVDEILDIKKELERPLKNFRKAILKYSTEIKEEAWHKEFPLYAKEKFDFEMLPIIEDLKEECYGNPALMLLHNELIRNSATALGFFSIFVGTMDSSTLESFAFAYGGSKLVDVFLSKLVNDNKLKKHDLYFYHQTSKKIENNSSKIITLY